MRYVTISFLYTQNLFIVSVPPTGPDGPCVDSFDDFEDTHSQGGMEYPAGRTRALCQAYCLSVSESTDFQFESLIKHIVLCLNKSTFAYIYGMHAVA